MPETDSIGPGERPNIIVIVIDDLRWDELAATGHPYIETPHVDQLAVEGGTLTSAFHAVPLCSPNGANILPGTASSTISRAAWPATI